jgi:hypothetical protein
VILSTNYFDQNCLLQLCMVVTVNQRRKGEKDKRSRGGAKETEE